MRIENGLPLAHLTVLGHLLRRKALSTNDLAAAERVRPQSMTMIVRSLENDGLVCRRPHPTDRRQTLIELTPKGSATLEEVFAMREDWLAEMIVNTLDAQERHELERGLSLLQRIIDQ